MQRLAVFAGSCTLEAAEAVCSEEGLEANHILALLAALVAKSMVVALQPPDQPSRYRLLQLVAQFCRDKVPTPEERVRLNNRHLTYYLELAETSFRLAASRQQFAGRSKVVGESDNLRLALEWAFS